METSWQNITRRLDINKVSRDTTCDKTRGHGRTIKKIPWAFAIPAAQIDATAAGAAQGGCLLRQLNYTAPRAFRILSFTPALVTQDIVNLAIVCVRYRVGTTVTRYRLRLSGDSAAEQFLDIASGLPVPAPDYSGERIQPNFCIEFWSAFESDNIVDMLASTVTTNLLELPADADELARPFEYVQQLERTDLELPMPETLPVDYGASSTWLTN
jgi:hypothetical protein